MNSIDSFTLFLEQHQQIKEAAKEAQIVLERIKEQGTEEGYQDVLDKLLHLKALLVDHGRQEEEVIVPLVKEMYRSPEMAQYVEEEHTQMEEDLKEIKNQLRLHISQGRERLDMEVYAKAKSFLTQTVTHIFEEESGLFPMLRGYLMQGGKQG